MASAESSSRYRWVILAMLLLISMVTYLDRVNISIAAKYIMEAYGLSAVDMGKIFSAFVFGYALFQTPFGWLADKFGARRLLTFAIIWWSAFTAVTAVAADIFTAQLLGVFGSFLLIRFLIGAGEAAAYPNFNRAIAFWMAPGERALANSLILGASGLGAAITPPLIGWIMESYGWQESFYVCAVIGVLIALIWYTYSTDRPEEHPRVTPSELAKIQTPYKDSASNGEPRGKLPLLVLLRNRNVCMLIASNFLFGYVAYIYLTWFYLYLVDVREFSILRGSFYATLPFVAITFMTPIGGLLSDRLCQVYGRRWGRRAVVMGGMSLTSVFVMVGGAVANPYLAIVLLSLGAGFLYFSLSPYWATVIDIARENTGVVSGMMNTGGNLGGTISPTLTPFIAALFGWSWALNIAALAAFLGGILWLWIDADQEVVGHDD
jgi:ACS family glucarate transporter-like MFS transporter